MEGFLQNNVVRVVRQYQEYPGATVWKDYEIKCPKCGKWTGDFGEVDELDEETGKWYSICNTCGSKAI